MTMKTFPLVVLICLLVAVRPAAARPDEDSLLVRYRRMALDCDDDLRAVAKRIEASAELERAARAERIPTLSAGGDFRYTGNPLKYAAELPGVGPLTLEGQNWKYGASATLVQPLYTGGRITGAIRMAESETRMSEARRELLRTEVCYRVDLQYWTTVARRERMSVAEDYLRAVADLERVVRERVEAGLCDRQELLTVEVKLNEARYRLLQVRSDFETGRMALNALIGTPLDAETPVGTSLPEVGPGASGLSAAALHPEVRLAQERIVWERATCNTAMPGINRSSAWGPMRVIMPRGMTSAPTFLPTGRSMRSSPYRSSREASDVVNGVPPSAASVWLPMPCTA